MNEIEFYVKSTIDGSEQPSLFFSAEGNGRPLLVGLHTWSFDRHNHQMLLPLAERLGFNLLMPEFRGPNLVSNPNRLNSCGSELAKQDILDAIDYAITHFDVDGENIFLVGGSGGGHMALLMAGYAPERFKAIASIVPITDLTEWVEQNPSYAEHIIACTGGDISEMLKRSPISYIDKIAKANLKIFHGKWDKSVPFMHSVRLYNELLAHSPSANVYLEIFDGGHEMYAEGVEMFIRSQYKTENDETLTG